VTFLAWLWRRDVEIFLAFVAVVLLLTCGGC
jgi:hypothetical protein